MPAHEHLSDVQFQYHPPGMGNESHRLTAERGGKYAGHLLWTSKQIRNIDVAPTMQRQGIATGMWNEGHRLAAENARIPAPKHSADRTTEGDAWARSVGGRLPRRK
jgi:hypothetical protein